jgi:DNA-binding NarL/FixJ family response regulator
MLHHAPQAAFAGATPADDGAPAPRLRVLLADDHAVVRMGLRTLIDAQPDMEVVGESADGRDVCSAVESLRPDVVVMDISMPVWSGVEATAQIRERHPEVRVLALSMHAERSYLRSLLEAGAVGYVLKRSAADELVRAIRAVATGGMYLDPALSDAVASSLVRGAAPVTGRASLRGDVGGTALSEREAEVLRLIAEGFTNKEIAVRLSISIKTVETYKARSMEKLGFNSRTDIVRYALAAGWLHGGAVAD